MTTENNDYETTCILFIEERMKTKCRSRVAMLVVAKETGLSSGIYVVLIISAQVALYILPLSLKTDPHVKHFFISHNNPKM